MSIKPYSTQLTLKKVQSRALKGGALDILFASVSTVFKKRAAGIILSGDEQEGDQGLSILLKNGGKEVILDSEECYSKNMGHNIVETCKIEKTYSTRGVLEKIKEMHSRVKYDGITS